MSKILDPQVSARNDLARDCIADATLSELLAGAGDEAVPRAKAGRPRKAVTRPEGGESQASEAIPREVLTPLYAQIGAAPADDVLGIDEWLSRVFARSLFLAATICGDDEISRGQREHVNEVRRLAEICKRTMLAAATAVAEGMDLAAVSEDAEPPLESPLHNALWACRVTLAKLDELLAGGADYEHLTLFRLAAKSCADLGIPNAQLLATMRALKMAKRAGKAQAAQPRIDTGSSEPAEF